MAIVIGPKEISSHMYGSICDIYDHTAKSLTPLRAIFCQQIEIPLIKICKNWAVYPYLKAVQTRDIFRSQCMISDG
jgi:hypothetical protein